MPLPANRLIARPEMVEPPLPRPSWIPLVVAPALAPLNSIRIWALSPSARVFASGDFADALDYSALVRRLQSLAKDHPHRLLERFADAVAHVVRETSPIVARACSSRMPYSRNRL